MKRESFFGTIDKFAVELDTKLRRFKEEFGVELLERTRARTPVKSGALKGGWGFTNKKTSIEIYNTQEYAAYVEFGTGPFAAKYVKQLPIEWQKYALTFYVNGKGRLPAHPYLYPAFNITKDMLIKDLQNIKL